VENKIVLITPPDKIFNQNHSCLLIYPSKEVKQQAQDILSRSNGRQNIYLYDVDDEFQDLDWLLTVAKMCDVVVLDLDNCSYEVKMFASYIISLPHTYWLTAEDTLLYNKLSPNRIYGLDVIEHLIGGKLEQAQ
jgi:hypothetical protein